MSSKSSAKTTTAAPVGLAVAVAAVVLAGVALILIQYLSLRTALLDDLQAQARLVGDNAASALLFNDAGGAARTLSTLATLPHVRQAELLASDGKALASYLRTGDRRNGAAWPAQGYRIRHDIADVVQPIEVDQQIVGWVRVRAGLEVMYSRLLTFAGTTLVVSAAALGLAFLLVARMREVLSRAESRMHYLVHTDPVTHLPNRHAFVERLESAASRVRETGGGLALLILDLDNFKVVNDGLGHRIGDLLLTMVAQRFSAHLRRDDVVCRTGGDEFAVVLENADIETNATGIARKLLDSLTLHFILDQNEVFVSASIGISFFPADAANTQELIRNADTALHAAKARGKGTFELFAPIMNDRAQQRLSLESRLRRALERREFELYYQPRVELASGRVLGVEALLRWNDGGRLVPPGDFVPVAEDTGLIVPIGDWVLQEACMQAKSWLERGIGPLAVAVNLSARQFDSGDLPNKVHAAVEAAGLDPATLELEITESALMHNAVASAAMLERLSIAGFKLAVDDFGTGYSSMAYLKRFPLHYLKIDRSFVTDLTANRDDEAIVAAIVAMAQALGLEAIAEGVEREEQYARLRELGCQHAQGYLISRPLPPAQLEPLLVARMVGVSGAAPGVPA